MQTLRPCPEVETCFVHVRWLSQGRPAPVNAPEVADLDIELGHAGVDFLSRSSLAVQCKRRCLLVAMEHAADD